MSDTGHRAKILMLAVGYPSEGYPAGAFHQEQFRAISEAGFEVTVVIPTPWVPPLLRSSERWKKYTSVPARQWDGDILILRPRYFTIPRENKWFLPDISQYLAVRALKLPRPDIIHGFHILPLGAVAAYLAHEFGVPFVTTAQGDDVNVYPRLNRRNGRVLRAAAQTADKVFATGATLTETTRRLTGVAVENLPIGVSSSRFENLPGKPEARAQLGLPPDRPIGLYVGRLVPGKGIENFADALNAVRDTPLLGVVIGDGPLMNEFARCDNVRCLGQKPPEDVAVAMAAADFLVLPSHSEGLPTVLMEAAFAGLPIITTDAPGCIDLGADGRALMVPVGDATALAGAFRTAIDHPETMQACAETMLTYAREHCSLEKNTQRLIDHYHDVISAKRN